MCSEINRTFFKLLCLDKGNADSSGEDDSDDDDEGGRGQPDQHDLVRSHFMVFSLVI